MHLSVALSASFPVSQSVTQSVIWTSVYSRSQSRTRSRIQIQSFSPSVPLSLSVSCQRHLNGSPGRSLRGASAKMGLEVWGLVSASSSRCHSAADFDCNAPRMPPIPIPMPIPIPIRILALPAS